MQGSDPKLLRSEIRHITVVVGGKKLAMRSGVGVESALYVRSHSGSLFSLLSLFSICRSLPPRSWKISMMRTSGLVLWMKKKTPLLPRNWVSLAAGPMATHRLLLSSLKVMRFLFFFPTIETFAFVYPKMFAVLKQSFFNFIHGVFR